MNAIALHRMKPVSIQCRGVSPLASEVITLLLRVRWAGEYEQADAERNAVRRAAEEPRGARQEPQNADSNQRQGHAIPKPRGKIGPPFHVESRDVSKQVVMQVNVA